MGPYVTAVDFLPLSYRNYPLPTYNYRGATILRVVISVTRFVSVVIAPHRGRQRANVADIPTHGLDTHFPDCGVRSRRAVVGEYIMNSDLLCMDALNAFRVSPCGIILNRGQK